MIPHDIDYLLDTFRQVVRFTPVRELLLDVSLWNVSFIESLGICPYKYHFYFSVLCRCCRACFGDLRAPCAVMGMNNSHGRIFEIAWIFTWPRFTLVFLYIDQFCACQVSTCGRGGALTAKIGYNSHLHCPLACFFSPPVSFENSRWG